MAYTHAEAKIPRREGEFSLVPSCVVPQIPEPENVAEERLGSAAKVGARGTLLLTRRAMLPWRSEYLKKILYLVCQRCIVKLSSVSLLSSIS